MQTRFLLTALFITTLSVAHSQDYNPFKSIGKKGKIVTAYGDRFVEVFDYDSIQRIGSVIFNIRTKKVVKLLNADTTFKKRSNNSSVSRWYSVDPLAGDFHNWSPYNFAKDNPIRFVDLDGRKPNDITLLVAKEGAGGHGHMGGVIQDGKGNYYYVTMGAAEEAGISKMSTSGVQGGFNVTPLTGAKSMDEAVSMAKQDQNNSPYTDQVTFKTDSKTDQKIFDNVTEKADKVNSGEEKYNVATNNCTDAIERPVEKATGISLPDAPGPNTNFQEVKNNKVSIQTSINVNTGNGVVKIIPSRLDGLPPIKVVVPAPQNDQNKKPN